MDIQEPIVEVADESDAEHEKERVQKLLDERRIGTAQKNVALQDLKSGKRFEYLPYLFVNRELPLDIVQEASKWYDNQKSEVFDTAIFLLNCNNITAKKMETARNYFDSLPPERELARLITGMTDEDFAIYLDEYKSSRDPVALAHRISSVEKSLQSIDEMKEMLKEMASVQKKENERTKDEKVPLHKNEAEEAYEGEKTYKESMVQNLEIQKASLERIEKMYRNQQINEAQRSLAKYHIMSGKAFEVLPYLSPNIHLTISMIDDVAACMEAGMERDVLSAVLQQPEISSPRLKIIYKFISNLPGKDELIKYLNEAESDEALEETLIEYKNRNDIEWVRGQLKDREKALHNMETRLKAAEEKIHLMKEEGDTGEEDAADEGETAETNVTEKTSHENAGNDISDGSYEAGDASVTEPADDEENSKVSEESGELPDDLPQDADRGQEVKEDSEKKTKMFSFFEQFLPGFFHAERKEYIENRIKDREQKKKSRELRAELERTVNDMYAQNVIDDEAYYIFADIAFKGQKMDKRVATFLVQELQNGVPFALLCKVVKNVKDSGDWASAAMVLKELMRYEGKIGGTGGEPQVAVSGV